MDTIYGVRNNPDRSVVAKTISRMMRVFIVGFYKCCKYVIVFDGLYKLDNKILLITYLLYYYNGMKVFLFHFSMQKGMYLSQ